ncbi:MAG: hypothetical protein J6A73_01785 [Lachnospiraceae bacterium]|nr:hypothetical protein [Lachnospiraceae bacterium]
MFADFNQIFQKNQAKNVPIPDVILQSLNKELKNGLKYVDQGNGICALSVEGEMTIGGLEIIVDDAMKEYLGEKFTQDEVDEYSYNTQRVIRFKCKNKGYIKLNEQEIPVDKLVFDPYKNIEFLEGEFFATPAPFPKPNKIVLGDGKHEIETWIRRIPCYERYCIQLETVEESPIYIKIKINNKTNRMNCDIKLKLINTFKVCEIVSTMSVFRALGTGKGMINGKVISLVEGGKNNFNFDDITLEFWKKVLMIEELLNCSFTVPEGEIEYKTIKDVERLYQMLIENNPIRSTDKLNSLTCALEINEGRNLEELKAGKGTFVFESTHMFDLFGVNITLPSITVMTDVVISDIIDSKEKKELIIDNSEVVAYYAELVFCNENDRNIHKEKPENLKAFYEAKTIEQYLI